MKKLLIQILVIVLLVTMTVPVFASEVNQDTADKRSETTVSFNVDPNYIVTIPATVELNKIDDNGTVTYENDYTITAEAGVRLKKGEYIEVSVASDFEMTTIEGATLAYGITSGGNDVANNGVIAEFDTDKAAQTAGIHIAANDPEFAGEYKDIVTFTLEVKTH